MAPILRPAEQADHDALYHFINSPGFIHRHLDWRDGLDWLGRQPFMLIEEDDQITAALACMPEPAEVAWVRLFAVSLRSSPDRAWQRMFAACLETLLAAPVAPAIVSLALREWYEELLRRNGFIHHQDIVVFMFDQEPPERPQIDPAIRLRAMKAADLPAVAEIDRLAFESNWRLSLDDLRFAMGKSAYCTVAEKDERVIGYTMSSGTGVYAHLARLAVDPAIQRQRLGYALVQDLLDYFINQNQYWGVTLNTQHDNHASLALYHNLGFRETGERFPVYLYAV